MGNCISSYDFDPNGQECGCLPLKRKQLKGPEEDENNAVNVPLDPLPIPESTPNPVPVPETTGNSSAPEIENQEVASDLKVLSVDLKCGKNGALHNTKKFELMTRTENPQLVIRRGQVFNIEVQLSRPFNEEADEILLRLSVADMEGKPTVDNGTQVLLPLSHQSNSNDTVKDWQALFKQIVGDKVSMQIKAPSKCLVGKWKVDVDTKLKGSTSPSAVNTYTLESPIFVLFNPWNLDDEVYLRGNEYRKEYVLRDTGLIWFGSHNDIAEMPWNYSQFEKDILDCAVDILSKHLEPSVRGNPVETVRALSALVNSQDDNGILVGNWSTDFSGGKAPSEWTGSAKILQKYHETKVPVRYAQCWVYSGVLATICRAIGIPSRPVTNFSSGHDRQQSSVSGPAFSLTIDNYIDEMGRQMDDRNKESTWNFHVWTEVWMKREDLGGEEYSGWQAIDSTPQERSGGIYRLGPASVQACRRGEINNNYDVDFLFGEVNADLAYWLVDTKEDKPPKLLKSMLDRSAIGLNISTKAVGKDEREDVTLKYKYPEGSDAERDTMLAAWNLSGNTLTPALRSGLNELDNEPGPVYFEFQLLDRIEMGLPFTAVLFIVNESETEEMDVKGVIRVDSKLYTGSIAGNVKLLTFEVKIPPGERHEAVLEVSFDDYKPHVTEKGAFNIAALAHVEQTDFHYFVQHFYGMRKPDIQFQVNKHEGEAIIVGEPIKVTVLLRNPLPVALQNCVFRIEAPGFGDPSKYMIPGAIEAGETAVADFEFVPRAPGNKTLTAKFESAELHDVNGFIRVKVNPPEH